MKIVLNTQFYSNIERRALWWRIHGGTTTRQNPESCPMATYNMCKAHLEQVGHSMDDDLNAEWIRAIEQWNKKQL